MKGRVLLPLVLGGLIVIIGVADAVRRPRIPTPKACHFRKMDKCLEKIESLGKRPQASAVITSEKGLDEICSTTHATIDCIRIWSDKCMTIMQMNLTEALIEQLTGPGKRFCSPNQDRTNFLQHSPCVHTKVLTQDNYQQKCVNDLFAGIYKASLMYNNTLKKTGSFRYFQAKRQIFIRQIV